MPNIIPITTTILGSEKAIALYEMHLQSPGNRGFHRYQIIDVVRDGKQARFQRDMGLAKKYKGVKYLRIPSLLEYTVDTLMGWAEELRNETEIDLKELCQLDRLNLTS